MAVYRHEKKISATVFKKLTDEIISSLKFLAEVGYRGFDCSEETRERLAKWDRIDELPQETLAAIRKDLGDCQRCPLSKGRKNIVFGAGNAHAKLVFVGEGPGFEEDLKGEPFVGAAGQLLTRIIEAMQLTRESVYICNIIKCRPPGNRNPTPQEIQKCSPFLKRQLETIQPKFICTLGTFATQTLLNSKATISQLRGRFHQYKRIRLMPTYHPAFLLRNPEKKRDVWEDMKKLMRAYQE